MSFQRFFARIPTEVLKRLFAQFIERLSTKDSIDFGEVFIDVTKLEADANRYTFVWKKRVNTELAKIPGKLDTIKADILAVTGEQVDLARYLCFLPSNTWSGTSTTTYII